MLRICTAHYLRLHYAANIDRCSTSQSDLHTSYLRAEQHIKARHDKANNLKQPIVATQKKGSTVFCVGRKEQLKNTCP